MMTQTTETKAVAPFYRAIVKSYLKEHGYTPKSIEWDGDNIFITIQHSNYGIEITKDLEVFEVLLIQRGSYEPMDKNQIEGKLEDVIKEVCRRSFWREGQLLQSWLKDFTQTEKKRLIENKGLRNWLREMASNRQLVTPENLPF